MRSFQVCQCGAPLQMNEAENPKPTGTQVLLKMLAAGVCHSDLHIWDGYYEIGGGKKLMLADRGKEERVEFVADECEIGFVDPGFEIFRRQQLGLRQCARDCGYGHSELCCHIPDRRGTCGATWLFLCSLHPGGDYWRGWGIASLR